MKTTRAFRETLLAMALLVFGLVCLPGLIFAVGQQVIGDYDTGLIGFYDSLGAALLGGNAFAWLLVLSPYITFLLLRAVLRLRRSS